MRGGTAIVIGRKLANQSTFSISRQTLAQFSTGGGGRGRGRGGPSPLAPSLVNYLSEQFPPQPDSDPPPASLPSAGHGRGKPLSQPPPSFAVTSAGRGQPSHVQPPAESRDGGDSGFPKRPIFFRREEDAEENQPADLMTSLGGTGRGSVDSGREVRFEEENRPIGAAVEPKKPKKPKLSREDAVKQAMGILQRGGGEGPEVDFGGGGGGGRGRGGGGGGGERMMRGRGGGGRGRGGRGRRDGEGDRRRDEDGGIAAGLYLGDNPDGGEKLAKKVGPEVMNQLNEAFDEIGEQVLPSPANDAYVDAFNTNCMIEFEPEYLMGEFNQNPDIDEKPPLPLRDALEKMKPFLMAYEGIQSQEEWEEAMKETMERVPLLKEIVDHYSGPDRVTAKTQKEELERVAKTLPSNVPDSVKQFTDRAVLSLQGNPGWGFHRKCQFMDKLTEKVSKHYK